MIKNLPMNRVTDEKINSDYSMYRFSLVETIPGFLIGTVAGAIALYIMFADIRVSVFAGPLTGLAGLTIYKNYLISRQRKTVLLQFRDMLDSLSNSFSAGKNTIGAFTDAYSDLKMTYGEGSPIVGELDRVIKGLYNNFTIEDLLKNMAVRCGLEDVNNFVETFIVCNRLGGDLKRIVSDSKEIINDKIEIEMEIRATIASNKNEINILCVMPFVIIALMKLMGVDLATDNSPLNAGVKIIAIIMFVFAYVLGRKIADIKV